MTNQIRSPNEWDFVRLLWLAGVSAGASAACGWAAGTSLGIFIGGLFTATFLIPAAVLGTRSFRRAIGGLAAVAVPISIAWLFPVLKGADAPGQWMQALLVLMTYCAAIGGFAMVLARLGIPSVLAAMATTFFSLATLTWPIWLSTMLVKSGHSALVQHLAPITPPLAINGVLTGEPAWTERSLAYHLTNLNQDVPIQLPANVGACAAWHGIVAVLLWSAAILFRKQKCIAGCCENTAAPLTVRPNA